MNTDLRQFTEMEAAIIDRVYPSVSFAARLRGPLHAWWDWIFDVEAIRRGEPEKSVLTPAELVGMALGWRG